MRTSQQLPGVILCFIGTENSAPFTAQQIMDPTKQTKNYNRPCSVPKQSRIKKGSNRGYCHSPLLQWGSRNEAQLFFIHVNWFTEKFDIILHFFHFFLL